MAPSIRLQLVAWVLGPLTAFFALSGLSSYRDARRTAELVADTALLGSARSIAERIEQTDGVVEALIPPSALERISTGQHDRVVYKVFWPGGDLLAGYPDVPEPPERRWSLDPDLVRRHLPGAARARSRDWAARRGPLRRLRGRDRRRDPDGRASFGRQPLAWSARARGRHGPAHRPPRADRPAPGTAANPAPA